MQPRATTRLGYVLVITLLLLVTVTLTLAGVCRASLSRMLQAQHEREALQQRWAVLSCQAALLPRAPELLSRAEQHTRGPKPSLKVDVILAGRRFELVLADEQAKVNAAALHNRLGRSRAEQLIKDLLRHTGCHAIVRIRPLNAGSEAQKLSQLPEIGSLSQILPAGLLGENDLENPRLIPADYLTCWGNGMVNYRRASRDVLATSCAGVLSRQEVGALTKLVEETPTITSADVLRLMKLNETNRKAAAALLTNESVCFSLRTTARGTTRAWHNLAIATFSQNNPDEPATIDQDRIMTFSW